MMEINSSPGFEGLERCSGTDVAGHRGVRGVVRPVATRDVERRCCDVAAPLRLGGRQIRRGTAEQILPER